MDPLVPSAAVTNSVDHNRPLVIATRTGTLYHRGICVLGLVELDGDNDGRTRARCGGH